LREGNTMDAKNMNIAVNRDSKGAAGLFEAVVSKLDEPKSGQLWVRRSVGELREVVGGEQEGLLLAQLALVGPYTPALGDRVVVVGDDTGRAHYLLGVLERRHPAPVELTDGDLTIQATGRVRLSSGKDLELEAGRAARLSAPQLEVASDAAELKTQQATVIAGRIATTATMLIQNVERLELQAERIMEKSRNVFREASELVQTRAGRIRTLVQGGYNLMSKRTSMVSDEETSIDGEKILLG